MSARCYFFQEFFGWGVNINGNDVGPWCHEIIYIPITETQSSIHEILFGFLKNSRLRTFLNDNLDLIFTVRQPFLLMYPENRKDGAAINEEILSGLLSANRLGTSSPRTRDRYVIPTTTVAIPIAGP
jgi:hypothetical protein